MEEMSCCGHTDCESIEDDESDFSGDGDFSSADEAKASPPLSQAPTQCNALALCSVHAVPDAPRLPPFSSRLLFHPTFEAYFAAVAVRQNLETPEMRLRREEGFTANPGEYFYIDPLLSPGQRVYNCLSPASHQVIGCFHLQTPPPIMSSCIFPSSYDDDPMGDDEDISEDISHNGGSSELPLLSPGSAPLDMVAPQCFVLPVSGYCETVSTLPSPALYTPSELEAVCGLLCLSAPYPRTAHNRH